MTWGFVSAFRGEHKEADKLLREAETLGRSVGEFHAATMAVAGRTHAAIARGQVSETDRELAACEAEIREVGVSGTSP